MTTCNPTARGAPESDADGDTQGQGKGKGKGSLSQILSNLVDDTKGEKVSLGELFDTLDQRSYGPLLLLPALIAVAPTGAIPGMSIVTGSIIALFAVQLLIGKSHPWLPERLERFEFSRKTLSRSVDKAMPWVKAVESHLRRRFTLLAEPPANRVVALLCLLLALTMFPLALLPFAVAVPGTAIMFFALGLTTRDGLLILAGFVFSAVAIALTYWAL